jgi:autotransporter-associated beta strand protein
MWLLLLSIASSSYADSARWQTTPATRNWNHAANWTPMTIPNGPSDIATFAFSNKTELSLSADTEVNTIVFNPGASAFTITASRPSTLTISGVGITNNSGIGQNFVTDENGAGDHGEIHFTNAATAGNGTGFTNNGSSAGSGVYGGMMQFFGTTTAGNGAFINNGGVLSGAGGGAIFFNYNSTAANGIFTNNGAPVSGAFGGFMLFLDDSTAGTGFFTNNGGTAINAEGGGIQFEFHSSGDNGTFINNGGAASAAQGGHTYVSGFDSSAGDGIFINYGGEVTGAEGGLTRITGLSTAASATLIATGGVGGAAGGAIQFAGRGRGGMARVEVFGTGSLDISFDILNAGVTVGSLEGDGLVFLGANKLTVGRNELSTTFSGLIQDGGLNGGTGGSLTKAGTGMLRLTHRNTYTGGTAVNNGTLLVKNQTGSATGTGAVQVNAGTLSGTGKIGGAVTVGTGGGTGALLSPGGSSHLTKFGTLTIQSALTFNSDATYKVQLNSTNSIADKVVADGVTINGAQFSFFDLGSGTLTPGTVFTVIDNTSASPIAGTFTNLADGAIFTRKNNSYQVNYESGDGNDLTLTVVP